MQTAEKFSVAMPLDMASDIRAAVEAGEYSSPSEAIRDAIRVWRRQRFVAALAERGHREASHFPAAHQAEPPSVVGAGADRPTSLRVVTRKAGRAATDAVGARVYKCRLPKSASAFPVSTFGAEWRTSA